MLKKLKKIITNIKGLWGTAVIDSSMTAKQSVSVCSKIASPAKRGRNDGNVNKPKAYRFKISFVVALLSLLSLYLIDGYAKHFVYIAQKNGRNTPIKISDHPLPVSFTIGDAMSFVASVNLVPVTVAHDPLQQISPFNRMVCIKASASNDYPLSHVNIYYSTDKDTEISTQTIIASYRTDYFVFTTTMTIENSSAQYFYYRMEAVSTNGKHGYWPNTAGNYAEVIKGKFSDIILKTVDFSAMQYLFCKVPISSENTSTITNKGGTAYLFTGNPYTGITSIEVPDGAIDSSINLKITELVPSTLADGSPPAVSQKPVYAYSFEPEGLVFKKPAKISLAFEDSNDNDYVDGTSYPDTSLRMFWWDGVAWRYMGGDVDTTRDVVSYDRITHFSMYALFPVASALSSDDYRPKERIITPATVDTKNDYINFSALASDDVVNIYDITGKRIRQLSGNANLAWDGKDENGKLVESGLYIYQIKKGKDIISGTVVVAK